MIIQDQYIQSHTNNIKETRQRLELLIPFARKVCYYADGTFGKCEVDLNTLQKLTGYVIEAYNQLVSDELFFKIAAKLHQQQQIEC